MPRRASATPGSAVLFIAAIGVLAAACVIPFHGASPSLAVAAATSGFGHSPPVLGTSDTLWRADMEDGSLSDWYSPEAGPVGEFGGGEYNTPPGDTVATGDVTHDGSWAAQLVYGGGFSGTRLFRWRELRSNRAVTIEQWMYIPSVPVVSNWWWLQEFKTTRESDGANEASWVIDAYNPSPGVLRGRLSWVLNQHDESVEGPHAGEYGTKRYPATVNFPIGRWFKSTLSIEQSKDFDGDIRWSIDDQLQASVADVRTAWPSSRPGNAWQTNMGYASISYGEGVSPAPFTYYIDDAEIRRWRIVAQLPRDPGRFAQP